MNKYLKLILLILLLALILVGAFFSYNYLTENENIQEELQNQNEQQNTLSQTIITATDFEVLNIEKEIVKLSDKFGKPIVVNAWASWCGPCCAELPDFQNAYNQYSGDVEFIMINMTDGYSETYERTLQFMKENNYTFPVYFDMLGQATNAYQIYSIPRTLFINSSGEIKKDYTGMISETILDAEIKNIL